MHQFKNNSNLFNCVYLDNYFFIMIFWVLELNEMKKERKLITPSLSTHTYTHKWHENSKET